MHGREHILSLVPHAGAMCLWDEVVEWDEQRVVLLAYGHRASDHPLRRDGRLSALHLCEYGAQAMAVHGGLLGEASGTPARPGVLVSLRGVELHCSRIDDLSGVLRCEARVLAAGVDSQQYAFEIFDGDVVLASGRAAAILHDHDGARAPDAQASTKTTISKRGARRR